MQLGVDRHEDVPRPPLACGLKIWNRCPREVVVPTVSVVVRPWSVCRSVEPDWNLATVTVRSRSPTAASSSRVVRPAVICGQALLGVAAVLLHVHGRHRLDRARLSMPRLPRSHRWSARGRVLSCAEAWNAATS